MIHDLYGTKSERRPPEGFSWSGFTPQSPRLGSSFISPLPDASHFSDWKLSQRLTLTLELSQEIESAEKFLKDV